MPDACWIYSRPINDTKIQKLKIKIKYNELCIIQTVKATAVIRLRKYIFENFYMDLLY